MPTQPTTRSGEGPPAGGALPRRTSMGEDVYEALLAELMDRTIAPGSKISIDGLARRLDVSPTPVREALARLEAEGLVHKWPNRGFTAAPVLDADGLAHLFAMRLLLEPAAAAAAAPRIGGAALDELDALVRSSRRFLGSTDPADAGFHTYREFAAQDAAIHNLIARQSGNPLLAEAIARLRPHMHLFRLYFEHGIATQTDSEHTAVLEALRSRDAPAAEAAMRDHISCSRDRMLGAQQAAG